MSTSVVREFLPPYETISGQQRYASRIGMSAQFVQFLDCDLLTPVTQYARREFLHEFARQSHELQQLELGQLFPKRLETGFAWLASEIIQRYPGLLFHLSRVVAGC